MGVCALVRRSPHPGSAGIPARLHPAGRLPAGRLPAGTIPAGTRPAGTRPASTRPAVRLLARLLLAGLLLAGCSDDKPTDTGGNGDPALGKYLLLGYFGGDVAPGGFGLYISRLDPSLTSAMEAEVTLDGEEVTLRPLLSTPTDAFYSILTLDYQAGETYTILASVGSRTAVCSFTGPSYPLLTMTAPPHESEFSPGDPLQLAWTYDAGAPEQVHIEAIGDEDTAVMTPVTLPGSATSYAIPGTVTEAWADQTSVLLTVDEGEHFFPFSGTLVGEGSGVATIGWGDAAIVTPGSGATACQLAALPSADQLAADGASTLTIDCALTAPGGDCADGTPIAFSCTPEGAVAFAPQTAYSSGGLAATVVTAGTSAGSVVLHCQAPDSRVDIPITLTQRVTIMVGAGSHPQIAWDPAEPMFTLLVSAAGALPTPRWGIAAITIGQITSPVTYGTVPGGTVQSYPLFGAPPAGLQAGATYRIWLVGADADTTSLTFTHGG